MKALFVNRVLYKYYPRFVTCSQRVECTCCGWTGRFFLPYVGRGHVQFNMYCPRCESHARHRAHRLLYDSFLDYKRWSGKVLYFAPEPSILPFLKGNSAARIETADYMMEDVDHRIDIMNTPFEDASYDVILCHHVIEHVPEDRKALKELKRILKRPGILFLSVPIDLKRVTTVEYAAPNPQFDDHYFCYGTDFKNRLQEVFPNVEEIRFSRVFTEGQIKRHGFKDEIAYVCRETG